MATDRLHVPRDQRTTVAVMGAIIVVAAIIVLMMITLMRNVGAY